MYFILLNFIMFALFHFSRTSNSSNAIFQYHFILMKNRGHWHVPTVTRSVKVKYVTCKVWDRITWASGEKLHIHYLIFTPKLFQALQISRLFQQDIIMTLLTLQQNLICLRGTKFFLKICNLRSLRATRKIMSSF